MEVYLLLDINESGSSVLSTKLTIDITEKHRQPQLGRIEVISIGNTFDDAEITVIDQVGDSCKGLKVTLIGTRA